MRKTSRTRLSELERERTSLEARVAAAEQKNRWLTDTMSALPLGVLVLIHQTVVLENTLIGAPTPNAGTNVLVRDAALSVAAACEQSGAVVQREVKLHGPPPFVFDITAHPLAGECVMCLVVDISEQRRLADIRRDFTINASHELRTPIGAIALLAETLEQEDDQANIKTLVAHLLREADRAQRLLEGVLDLARFEAGQRPQPDEVDLGWVAGQAQERLAPQARDAGIELRLDTSPDRAAKVAGEAEQLVSAVTNLVDNAIKYSTNGGSVSISVTREHDWATVAVADRGVGIPSRDLDRIFERFYRVDRGRDRRTGGTGLGLSIARHIAENHGGRIDVESVEGRGSTFFLVLPVQA